jgi:hypothetical protein
MTADFAANYRENLRDRTLASGANDRADGCFQATWAEVPTVRSWPDSSENALIAISCQAGETRDYAGRFFCPRCGSSIFARTADEIEVNLGSLDAPDQLMPTYESWIVRRESWLPPFPLTRRYERDRDATGRFEE